MVWNWQEMRVRLECVVEMVQDTKSDEEGKVGTLIIIIRHSQKNILRQTYTTACDLKHQNSTVKLTCKTDP